MENYQQSTETGISRTTKNNGGITMPEYENIKEFCTIRNRIGLKSILDKRKIKTPDFSQSVVDPLAGREKELRELLKQLGFISKYQIIEDYFLDGMNGYQPVITKVQWFYKNAPKLKSTLNLISSFIKFEPVNGKDLRLSYGIENGLTNFFKHVCYSISSEETYVFNKTSQKCLPFKNIRRESLSRNKKSGLDVEIGIDNNMPETEHIIKELVRINLSKFNSYKAAYFEKASHFFLENLKKDGYDEFLNNSYLNNEKLTIAHEFQLLDLALGELIDRN
jgi:hypothetical protein